VRLVQAPALRASGINTYAFLSETDGGAGAITCTANVQRTFPIWENEEFTNNISAEVPAGNLTAQQAGLYWLGAQFSVTSSINNVTLEAYVVKNGANTNIEAQRKISTGADVGSFSLIGLVSLAEEDVVRIDIKTDANTGITGQYAQLVLVQLAGS